ncbi:hypothetical protein TK1373 [Thermococcus kodakarensis KOD1]|uniref:SHOCT domain-containing protein n=1 Tax=Thermococcus kodakarensis (strain ATCC BAA-918 / JCM 12380 / KOD1) TaxID=69014 RepID=Q5JGY2_THEKO|nr:hypothetical protein [Thermococcus kodakarensis]WCN27352.1 hypothetical protein POG15_06975 [Thermococcus kodakarensis]WCN29641.1 hypothetical protein POG21_06970 [Thermococcus kodakarensis]BAD85562.1 hypothetical protein TK1373 [Thermococcus kodakarensis KOD1]
MTKLTLEEVQRRRELTEKLRAGTITRDEAIELAQILEKEKKIAEEQKDFNALLAIILLLGLLYALTKEK